MNLNFKNNLIFFKESIDKELLKIYPLGPELLKKPIDYVVTGGKRLRPSLCLLICNSFNKNISKALIPAVSIELLHLFSLVHDDIMDNDDYRHSKKTIHKKWNVPVAILVGDAILALAFKRLNNADHSIKELFNSALIAVCEGQALDIEYELLDHITEKEYLNMIDLKTGHMLGLSAQLGGILSNLSIDKQSKLKNYGTLIGRAFQIQDDILEVMSNTMVMGKSLDSDFILGKKTYLMIKAKDKCPKEMIKIQKQSKKDYSLAFTMYKDLLIKEGIIDQSISFVNNTFNEAELISQNIISDNSLINFIKILKNRKF